jgi:hypothetical protein
MAIDIEKEEIISLTEAAHKLPKINGRHPAICTLWRWCRKGLRGTHLEYIRVGRGIATSSQAMNRFFNSLAENDQPLSVSPPPTRLSPPVTSKSRQRAIEEAGRICQEAGI